MVTAFGKKLSLSLFVLASMDLKRLPEGNRLKRWKPGCVLSFRMDLALLRQRLMVDGGYGYVLHLFFKNIRDVKNTKDSYR